MTAVEQPTVGARSFETGCGRQVRVGTMILGDSQWSALRVSVDIGACPGCGDGTWVTFTTAEARQLAGALLAEAAAAEHPDRPPRMPAGQLAVTHADGDSYTIVTRGHTVLVDQPIDAGGADTAATPTEMFVGSLASCVAFYAGQFLQRHGLDRHGLSVSADFTMAADRPAGSPPCGCGSPCLLAFQRSGEPPCSPWPPTAQCTTPCSTRQPCTSNSADALTGRACGTVH